MQKNIPQTDEQTLQEILSRTTPTQDTSSENNPISDLLQNTLKALEDLTNPTQEKK